MARPASPVDALLQFKREAVWATNITATKQMPIRLMSFDLGVGAISSDIFTGTSPVVAGIAKGGTRVKATFETDLQYLDNVTTDPDGFLMLHDLIMGANTFGTYQPTATTGAAPPYIHTFQNLNTLNSATIEFVDGKPGGSNVCLRLDGCKVDEAVWSWGWSYDGKENIPTLRVTVVGRLATPSVVPTALGSIQQTYDGLISTHCTFADGLVSPATTGYFKAKLTCKNNVYQEGFSSLSGYITEPIRLSNLDAEWEFEGDYDSMTALTSYINQSASATAISALFTKPSPSGTGTTYTLATASGKAKMSGHAHEVTQGSPVRQTVKWRPFKDANGSAFSVAIACGANCPIGQG